MVSANMLSKARLILVVCAVSACLAASARPRQGGGTGVAIPPEIQSAPTAPSDFEVKIHKGTFLVRRKGDSDWKQCSEMSEPVAVGVLDGGQKVYLVTKAIIPPKPLHPEMPKYPERWRKSRVEGEVSLHFIVDDHGIVRFPKVDVSTAPEFTAATIDTVNKWHFQSAKLNGQPVAVLVESVTVFRLE